LNLKVNKISAKENFAKALPDYAGHASIYLNQEVVHSMSGLKYVGVKKHSLEYLLPTNF